MIFNMSGGSSLNFKIVAYATEADLVAATPPENTIGVITENKITGYCFSPTEPPNLSEGLLWITTRTSSEVAFNILKKNDVTICPMRCQQYISGEWVPKVAKSYMGNSWKPWETYLKNYLDMCELVTGGWQSLELPVLANGYKKPVTVKLNADGSHTLSEEAGYAGCYLTTNKIDLTPYKTLIFDGIMKGSNTLNGDYCSLYIWRELPTETYPANADASLPTFLEIIEGERYLDVTEFKGEFYIGFGLYSSDTSITINSLRLTAATVY